VTGDRSGMAIGESCARKKKQNQPREQSHCEKQEGERVGCLVPVRFFIKNYQNDTGEKNEAECSGDVNLQPDRIW